MGITIPTVPSRRRRTEKPLLSLADDAEKAKAIRRPESEYRLAGARSVTLGAVARFFCALSILAQSIQVPQGDYFFMPKGVTTMKYDAFSRYHPLVNFLYFAGAIGFGVVIQHPAYMLAAVLGSAA